MTSLKFDPNLRRSVGEIARNGSTHQGQASWAEGPDACRDCVSFEAGLKGKARAAPFARMMRLHEGPLFPASAFSCRFFESREP